MTPPEIQRGISYFQQAIQIDPNYALAYAGLGDAYRSLVLSAETPPSEFLPKAKLPPRRQSKLMRPSPKVMPPWVSQFFGTTGTGMKRRINSNEP